MSKELWICSLNRRHGRDRRNAGALLISRGAIVVGVPELSDKDHENVLHLFVDDILSAERTFQ